jgi:hypothetical protein
MTYGREVVYYSTNRFFDNCAPAWDTSKSGYGTQTASWCTPTYTACAGGWIEGPGTSYRWYANIFIKLDLSTK